jgi:hypothetical protein
MVTVQVVVIFLLIPLAAAAVAAGLAPVVRGGEAPSPLRFSLFGKIMLTVALTSLLEVGTVGWGTVVLASYGPLLFFAQPFVIGLFSSLLLSRHDPRSYRESLGAASLAVLGTGVGLIAVGVEGAGCLVMALPLALLISGAGTVVGYALTRIYWGRRHSAALLVLTALASPLLMGADAAVHPEPPVYAVRTAVEVDAPPEVVWRHVVSFPALPADREWLFHTGIAYPLRAEIRGRGAGAVRYCVFSTGAFVEPIEVWDEPRLLRFSVVQSPPAMEELSPYAIQPPHVEGFLVSRRGQFALEPLPGGRTRLVGTTWYQHGLQPAGYWRLWSDWILHRIHTRVLEHVKRLAEAQAHAA